MNAETLKKKWSGDIELTAKHFVGFGHTFSTGISNINKYWDRHGIYIIQSRMNNTWQSGKFDILLNDMRYIQHIAGLTFMGEKFVAELEAVVLGYSYKSEVQVMNAETLKQKWNGIFVLSQHHFAGFGQGLASSAPCQHWTNEEIRIIRNDLNAAWRQDDFEEVLRQLRKIEINLKVTNHFHELVDDIKLVAFGQAHNVVESGEPEIDGHRAFDILKRMF